MVNWNFPNQRAMKYIPGTTTTKNQIPVDELDLWGMEVKLARVSDLGVGRQWEIETEDVGCASL